MLLILQLSTTFILNIFHTKPTLPSLSTPMTLHFFIHHRYYFPSNKTLKNTQKTGTIVYKVEDKNHLQQKHNMDQRRKILRYDIRQKTHSRKAHKILEKAHKVTRIFFSLLKRNLSMYVDNKLLLYKVMFRPILAYGCPAFDKLAKSHLKKLQIFQNKTIKMIINMKKKS